MGRKNKLKRFAEMKAFDNVIEAGSNARLNDHKLKGKWRQEVFKNDNPVVLELGCGKAEYAVQLSEQYPEKNFIAMDIKGSRMWVGASKCHEEKRKNIMFLRTRIDFVESFFAKDEVDEIWITFPDPQPQEKREKKRLTSPSFLNRYKSFLRKNGIIHLKTDDLPLHIYTREVINDNNYSLLDATTDVYGEKLGTSDTETASVLSIRTYYESKFLEEGKKITWLKFSLE